jgi:hypothetical protein
MPTRTAVSGRIKPWRTDSLASPTSRLGDLRTATTRNVSGGRQNAGCNPTYGRPIADLCRPGRHTSCCPDTDPLSLAAGRALCRARGRCQRTGPGDRRARDGHRRRVRPRARGVLRGAAGHARMRPQHFTGDLLVKNGVVDAAGLARAIALQSTRPATLGRTLAELGLADESVVAKTIASALYLGTPAPAKPRPVGCGVLSLGSRSRCAAIDILPMERIAPRLVELLAGSATRARTVVRR